MVTAARSTSRTTAAALLALLLGLVVWLWPIGFGGRMPVGGDVTQFSLGLMAVLARALRAGRLPVWNHLWGYGFPGLAESQMGVYYPPHAILYRVLSLEAAYTASLVLHTLWGGLGAYWAARRLGVSPSGSALAGFAWGTSGFFLIHLPHQWGYTVGSWMPWAWGLAWESARERGNPRAPMLLALVLTLQVLPGHFQLAFCTQVGVVLLSLGGIAGRSPRWQGPGRVLLAVAAVLPLGALQLWPTYRLARLAASRRDFEYLSGFASTPLHLISYVAPGLFQRSPLWRPLAWDPFHTSPEEHLAYIGLAPLFLALATVVHGFRREPAVRALSVVAVVTLFFSLGPYAPGFGLWRQVPGFSFFRAPARWSLATGLALSLLAGKGFDAWRTWPRPGRLLAWFVVLAALAPGLVVLGVELALTSTERPGQPAVAAAFDRAMNLLPWPRVDTADHEQGDDRRTTAREPSFRELMAIARAPQEDARVHFALARQGMPKSHPRFVRERSAIYRAEFGETGVVLLCLLAIAPLARCPRPFAAALAMVTVLDLWSLGRHRPIDSAPIRPLTRQSAVLGALASAPPATRTIDASRNLPMVAGAAPIASYRTLDLPALTSLTALARAPMDRAEALPTIAAALRATGAGIRVLDPSETVAVTASGVRLPGWEAPAPVRDPALAGWLYGDSWVRAQGPGAATFSFWRPRTDPASAWLVPLTSARTTAILKSWTGRTADVLAVLDRATPLAHRRPWPERLEIAVNAAGADLVIVSQLADPQWRARWRGPRGEQDATILPVFTRPHEAGWQAVSTPGPGAWTLRMDYHGHEVVVGLAVSAAAGTTWLALFWRIERRSKATQDPLT